MRLKLTEDWHFFNGGAPQMIRALLVHVNDLDCAEIVYVSAMSFSRRSQNVTSLRQTAATYDAPSGVERRTSPDGGRYTRDQFLQFFGEGGEWYWQQAEVSFRASGENAKHGPKRAVCPAQNQGLKPVHSKRWATHHGPLAFRYNGGGPKNQTPNASSDPKPSKPAGRGLNAEPKSADENATLGRSSTDRQRVNRPKPHNEGDGIDQRDMNIKLQKAINSFARDSPSFGPTGSARIDSFLLTPIPCAVCPVDKCQGHEDQQQEQEDQQLNSEDELLDLVVIGAGPHALSLVCRLVDDEPDLLPEIERQRMMTKTSERLNGHTCKGGRKAERREGGCGATNRQVRHHLSKSFDATTALPKSVVVDSHGEWMAEWKQNFDALEIQTTRSHADFHPCPFDYKSLRVWAHQQHRQSELHETRHLDKEAIRKAGFENNESSSLSFNKTPYVLPSTSLFNDFCDDLVTRYNLDPLLRKGYVTEVKVVHAAISSEPCTFEVYLADGNVLKARKVVCAMGPGPMFKGMRPKMPCWVSQLLTELSETDQEDAEDAASRVVHSQELVEWFRRGNVPVANSRILIIGGGQTAAHLALKAARADCKVTLATRRLVSVRPFDLPNQAMGLGDFKSVGDERLGYLGRDRADMLAKVHRRLPKERVEIARQLRGGGSVSPQVFQELLELAESSELSLPSSAPSVTPAVSSSIEVTSSSAGSLSIGAGSGSDSDSASESASVSSSVSSNSSTDSGLLHQLGSVKLMEEAVVVKAGCNNAAEIQVQFEDGTEGEFDYIWLATGGNLDLHAIPLLDSVTKQWPIDIVDHMGSALPVLQPDLSWDVNCPLYILGAFAQIELGPDALNVAGARSGSVLVAKALMEFKKEFSLSRMFRYYM